MLREQAGLSEKVNYVSGTLDDFYEGMAESNKSFATALANNGKNQMIDNKNILSIGNTVNTMDKKLDASVEKLYGRLGAVIATLDNQWANRR